VAKRSVETLSTRRAAKEAQRQRPPDIRWYRRNLPLPPSQPIEAYFIRLCRTLRDVLRLYGVDSTPGSDIRELKRRRAVEWAAIRGQKPDFGKADAYPAGRRDVRKQRRAASKALVEALDGKGEFAEVPVPEWRVLCVLHQLKRKAKERAGVLLLGPGHPDPEVYVAGELEFVERLIGYYEDPAEFFCDIAPSEWFRYFNPKKLAPRGGGNPNPALLETMWTWGRGALKNPVVRKAFDAAPQKQKEHILSIPDRRESFKEGRPLGATDSTPRSRRPDVAATGIEVDRRARELENWFGPERGNIKRALLERSRATGVPFETLRKRLYRRPPRF
jgi:hypothetical protein